MNSEDKDDLIERDAVQFANETRRKKQIRICRQLDGESCLDLIWLMQHHEGSKELKGLLKLSASIKIDKEPKS